MVSRTLCCTWLPPAFALLAAGTLVCTLPGRSADARNDTLRLPAMHALAADSAADMVGVNTHLYYTKRIYGTAYDKIVRPRLLQSGIRHIRDGLNPSDSDYDNKLKDLAHHGIHSLLIAWDTKSVSAEKSRDAVKALNAGSEKPVEMVEDPNEVDKSGSGWEARLHEEMVSLWKAFKDDPATRDIPIVGPSFANTRDSATKFAQAEPGMTAYMDYGNLHSYSGGNAVEGRQGGGWGITLDAAVARYRKLAEDKPLIATEIGYHNAIAGGVPGFYGVSELAAAKYFPRLFLTYLKKGVRRAYIYEFMDEKADPKDLEGNFGLVHYDGSLKKQFVAVFAFLHLLSDPGPTFTPGSLHFRLDGDTNGIDTALLQKRDGRFYLALWQTVDTYDAKNHTDIQTPARKLTLQLENPAQRIVLYRPATDDMNSVGSFTNKASVSLAVPDQVLFVEITP